MSVLLPLDELNELLPAEFSEALKPLFETAAPLAPALFAERPFASYATLIARAEVLAAALPEPERIDVVNAHPRIGAPTRQLSALSLKEQAYPAEAGELDPPLAQVHTDLAELNARYESQFGFRFVVFVNRRSKAEILEVLRSRLHNSREVELRTGLREMFRIARDRLASMEAT